MSTASTACVKFSLLDPLRVSVVHKKFMGQWVSQWVVIYLNQRQHLNASSYKFNSTEPVHIQSVNSTYLQSTLYNKKVLKSFKKVLKVLKSFKKSNSLLEESESLKSFKKF